MNGWIGVDLDGTLAEYHGWPADGSIGPPVSKMVERVRAWLNEGKDVRIFTARVWPLGTVEQNSPLNAERTMQACQQRSLIDRWCDKHLGARLWITCIKDYNMLEFWDDRAVQVEKNTGQQVSAAGISIPIMDLMLAIERGWHHETTKMTPKDTWLEAAITDEVVRLLMKSGVNIEEAK